MVLLYGPVGTKSKQLLDVLPIHAGYSSSRKVRSPWWGLILFMLKYRYHTGGDNDVRSGIPATFNCIARVISYINNHSFCIFFCIFRISYKCSLFEWSPISAVVQPYPVFHDEVITWKYFLLFEGPHNWPLSGEFTCHCWIPLTNSAFCVLCRWLEKTVEQTVDSLWFETPYRSYDISVTYLYVCHDISRFTFNDPIFNPLWPSDTIWRHGSVSTLAQIMVCCLMAPSHYLNQFWLIIREVRWHSY